MFRYLFTKHFLIFVYSISILIFQVLLCIIIACFSLGQASPHFQAVTTAQAAAYIVWKIIDAVSN
jgi:hypothetical protein